MSGIGERSGAASGYATPDVWPRSRIVYLMRCLPSLKLSSSPALASRSRGAYKAPWSTSTRSPCRVVVAAAIERSGGPARQIPTTWSSPSRCRAAGDRRHTPRCGWACPRAACPTHGGGRRPLGREIAASGILAGRDKLVVAGGAESLSPCQAGEVVPRLGRELPAVDVALAPRDRRPPAFDMSVRSSEHRPRGRHHPPGRRRVGQVVARPGRASSDEGWFDAEIVAVGDVTKASSPAGTPRSNGWASWPAAPRDRRGRHHRRQRRRAERRRCGGRHRRPLGRRRPRAPADRPNPVVGLGRRRSGPHRHGPHRGHPQGAGPGRLHARRHRPVRDQRGVHARRGGHRPQARHRAVDRQRERQRLWPRPPDRRHRHPHGGHDAERARTPWD